MTEAGDAAQPQLLAARCEERRLQNLHSMGNSEATIMPAVQAERGAEKLAHVTPSAANAPPPLHRRAHSDPTDLIQALRSERSQKRDLPPFATDEGMPAKKRTSLPCTMSSEVAPVRSKKDVALWTVEEDLLILQLVKQVGKKWSRIAAQLPGRTDNSVRNRWNRMERGQALRESHASDDTDTSYRCRRCFLPKRGHSCAAVTMRDAPANADLQAAAFCHLTASMKSASSSESMIEEAEREETEVAPQPTLTPQLLAASLRPLPLIPAAAQVAAPSPLLNFQTQLDGLDGIIFELEQHGLSDLRERDIIDELGLEQHVRERGSSIPLDAPLPFEWQSSLLIPPSSSGIICMAC